MQAPLTIYCLIDCSGSMRGEPIEAIKVALDTLYSTLRSIEPVPYIKVWGYAHHLIDLGEGQISEWTPPEITYVEGGASHLGQTLNILVQDLELQANHTSVLLLFSDGQVNDLLHYKTVLPLVKCINFHQTAAFLAGPHATEVYLKHWISQCYVLETMPPNTFRLLLDL
jgi:uncharacterized protein YegL